MIKNPIEKTNEKDEQINLLKNGNTQLIDALMSMVEQFFYFNEETKRFSHSFMSAEEYAIETLIKAGFAKEDDKGYILEYEKLEKRQIEEQES